MFYQYTTMYANGLTCKSIGQDQFDLVCITNMTELVVFFLNSHYHTSCMCTVLEQTERTLQI